MPHGYGWPGENSPKKLHMLRNWPLQRSPLKSYWQDIQSRTCLLCLWKGPGPQLLKGLFSRSRHFSFVVDWYIPKYHISKGPGKRVRNSKLGNRVSSASLRRRCWARRSLGETPEGTVILTTSPLTGSIKRTSPYPFSTPKFLLDRDAYQ